jgi:hypothetical protein
MHENESHIDGILVGIDGYPPFVFIVFTMSVGLGLALRIQNTKLLEPCRQVDWMIAKCPYTPLREPDMDVASEHVLADIRSHGLMLGFRFAMRMLPCQIAQARLIVDRQMTCYSFDES